MQIKKSTFDKLLSIIKGESKERIDILRGCRAAEKGGCACLGICNDVIGYYENGTFTSIEPEPRIKEIGFTSYKFNTHTNPDSKTMRTYTKISPLGERIGPGTFEFVFDTEKYKMEEAIVANDGAIVDFVQDENGIIYFEAYDTKSPENKQHVRLQIQHFPFGIDIMDDQAGYELGCKVLGERK